MKYYYLNYFYIMIVLIFNIINSNSLLFIHILLMSLILEKPLIDEVEGRGKEFSNFITNSLVYLYTYEVYTLS